MLKQENVKIIVVNIKGDRTARKYVAAWQNEFSCDLEPS